MLRRQSQHNNHHGGGSNHLQGGGNLHNHFLQEARLAAAALRASNASKSPPPAPAAARPAASPPVARLLKRIRPTPVCPGAPVRPKKKKTTTPSMAFATLTPNQLSKQRRSNYEIYAIKKLAATLRSKARSLGTAFGESRLN